MAKHLVERPCIRRHHLVGVGRGANVSPFVQTDGYRLCFEGRNAFQVLLIMLVFHADLSGGGALPFKEGLRPGADLFTCLTIRSLAARRIKVLTEEVYVDRKSTRLNSSHSQ